MARILTAGGEWGFISASLQIDNAEQIAPAQFGTGAAASVQTGVKRSGSYGLKADVGSQTSRYALFESYFVRSGTEYEFFTREAVRWAAWPGSNRSFYAITDHYPGGYPSYSSYTDNAFFLRIGTTGLLTAWARSGFNTRVQQGGSTQLSLDTWYVIESHFYKPQSDGNQVIKVRVDGTEVISTIQAVTGVSGQVLAYHDWGYGGGTVWQFTDGTTANDVMYLDDLAINDSSSASQNSFPGLGQVILLRPVSDNARSSGMVGGAGGTTNLYDAVDNRPPVGVAVASASNTSQIKDAASSATDNYDADVTDYTTAGVSGTDSIVLAQAQAAISASVALSMAVKAVSNPADSGEVTGSMGVAGTYPTGWLLRGGNYVYAPSVTLGTKPVVRFGKRAATTNVATCCALGLMIEYAPAVAASAPLPPSRRLRQAVNRAASY